MYKVEEGIRDGVASRGLGEVYKRKCIGRYGRSNRINACVPESVDPIAIREKADPMMVDVVNAAYRLQDRL